MATKHRLPPKQKSPKPPRAGPIAAKVVGPAQVADTPESAAPADEVAPGGVPVLDAAAAATAATAAALPVADARDLVRELPEEVVAFLVRTTPPRALWTWLSDDERVVVRHQVTRGFQRTLNVLRQPVVRNRLLHHLYDKPDDFTAVLRLWGEATPPPPVISAVRELDQDETLIAQLAELWQRYGAEALLLALLLDDRRTALDALDRIAEAEDETGSDAAPGNGDTAGQPPPREGSTLLTAQRRSLVRRTGKRRANDAPGTDATTPLAVPPPDWQERAVKAETRLQTSQAELTATRTSLGETQHQLRQAAQTHKRELHHVQQCLDSSEVQLQETKKLFDRTARRLKSVQREEEELAGDNKRLKRQLRRQQQLNEELRKQLANVSAKLQSLTPPPAAATTTPARASELTPARKPGPLLARQPPVAPLDQPFLWQSDGRPFRVTPREVKRAIDRNDEEFVFTLIQGLDALRETNKPGYSMFLDRIREFDRYYSRVLTVATTRVLIDASNVVRYEANRYGKGQLRHLLTMRDELRRRDCFPIRIYADASLPYHIDEPAEFHQMVKSGEVQMTIAGQEADELLAREARRTGAYVVTNDRSFHTKVAPDFEPPRVTFRIHDGFLVVDDF